MEDNKIIERYWSRSELAIEATRQKYGGLCLALSERIVGSFSDAEECLSDTLMRLWSVIPPQRPQNLKAYISKLIRNISIDRVRANTAGKRGSGEYLSSVEELDSDPVSPSDIVSEAEARELGRAVSDFLRTRKPLDRRVFLRRYYYFDSSKAIAAAEGINDQKVRHILSRVRRELREYLTEEGYIG